MTKYRIILENVGGKLDERSVTVADDPELTEAVVDFIWDIGTLRDGDVIRIVELTEVVVDFTAEERKS